METQHLLQLFQMIFFMLQLVTIVNCKYSLFLDVMQFNVTIRRLSRKLHYTFDW